MLIDRATIFVRSGHGGDGCVSFRREKFVPKGGPDGGDGGRGGDVILQGTAQLTTLLPLTPRPHYRAANGTPGMGKSRHGANAEARIVKVPLGTLVYDHDTGELLVDIDHEGQEFIAARGGRGGWGNEHFKSATNQTPREATPGEAWEEKTLRLELKLIADVGLVGLPNAGKSTFLRAVSRATPKVAAYPFTTLSPVLGIAELPAGGDTERRLVIADIPGLIEGAANGAGLGHDFLRHIERTKVLLHLVDIAPADGSDPRASYEAVRRELEAHSPALAETPEIVVLNKVDLAPKKRDSHLLSPDPWKTASGERRKTGDCPGFSGDRAGDGGVLLASGATGEGLREVLEACWRLVGAAERSGWTVKG